uniref:Variant surface glycoprotein c1 n=1 Tax=Trypanosoma evansi TaxID=5697 RepID=D9IL94_TRYEV|nr:variant surface glycoprotein c1 [Trypanosoma evansi]
MLTVLLAGVLLIAATAAPDVTAEVTDFCVESWYAEELQRRLANRVDEAQAAITKAERDVRLFTLATMRHQNTRQHLAYETLKTAAIGSLRETAEQANTFIQKHVTALRLLSAKIASIKTTEAVATATTQPAAAGTYTGAESNIKPGLQSHYCTVKQVLKLAASKTCSAAAKTKAQAAALASTQQTWEKLPLRKKTALAAINIEARTAGKGSFATTGAFGNGADFPGCESAGGSSGFSSQSNLIATAIQNPSLTYVKQPITLTPQQQNSPDPQHPGKSDKPDITLSVDDSELATAIKAALSQTPITFTAIAEQQLPEILTRPAVEKFALGMLAATNQGKKDTLDEQTKAKLLFGQEKPDINALYIANLDKDEITISSSAPEIKGTTKKLSETNFPEAIGYFYATNLKKAANTKGTKPEVEGEKEDSADKTGEKKDVDNKTATNTTVSNSFAINKAPLLLAVFLF